MSSLLKKTNNILPIILLFIFFSGFIIVGGILWYNNQKQVIKQNWHDTLNSIAELKLNQINRWRHERINDAAIITKRDKIIEYLTNRSLYEKHRSAILSWINLIQDRYDYDAIYLLNKEGDIVLYSNDSIVRTLNEPTLQLFKEALKTKKTLFSDFYYCQPHKKIHIDLIAPVISREPHDTEVVGGIIFMIDPQKFLFPLIQSWHTPSPTAETLLIRKEGDAVLFLNPLRHNKKGPLCLKKPLSDNNMPAARAVEGYIGVMEGNDYRGIPVLAVTKAIPGTPWHMVAKIDREEIFGPLYHEARLIISGAIVLILLLGAVLGWNLTAQRKKHYERLYRLEQEHKAIQKHFEYLVKYANDIILLLDQAGNLKEVNDRAMASYGYGKEELLQLNIQDLLASPDSPSLFSRFQENPKGEGVVYESLHRRRDGGLFPVEVSVNQISLEGQNYFQEIIRDISERKQAEEKIKLNEARLASMVKIGQYESESIQDLLDFALHEAINLTGSKIGYIYIYDNEKQQFTLNTWSKEVMKECTIAEPQTIYQLEKTGIWGEAVRQARPIIINDFQAPHPLKKGYPEGHATLYRYLTIPIFSGERIVAVVGVANKATDYDAGDVRQLSLMIDTVWKIKERRQAEQELRAREQEYRSLVNNIPGFVFKGFADFTVEFFDNRIDKFTGYTQEEFNAKRLKWSELIIHEDLQTAKAVLVQALKLDGHYVREYRLRKKDGEIVWIQERSQIVKDQEGRIDYISGIFFDITGLKQAEEALQETQKKLTAILETTPAGIFLVNPEGAITFANRMMANLFAYRDDDILGTAYQDLVHPTERSVGYNKMKSLMAGEIEFVSLERHYLAADGRDFWGHLSGCRLLGSDGGFVGLVGVITDITAHKMVEEELRLKEKLLDSASDSIFLHDHDGRILYVNEAAYRHLGYAKEELLSLDISALISPEFAGTRKTRLQDLLIHGEIIFESEHVQKNGAILPVEIHARTIDLDHGQLILSVARDIRERREAEINLRKEKTLSDNIINSLPAIFYLFDETGRFLRWNKNFEHVTGYSGKEFDKLAPLDLFEGEAKHLIENAIREVFLKGETTAEADLLLKNGSKIPYFFTGRRVTLEGVPYLIGMGVDISDRKQAEDKLRLAAEKWRTTFDALGDAVCLIDRDLKITQCNQAMVKLAGKPFNEIIGNTCWEVLSGTDEAPEGCACVKMLESHRREAFTLPLGDRWLHAMAHPILDEAGKLTGGVYIIADITAYQLATQRIKDLNVLLTAIKDINEALLRVKDETDLFRKTCELLLRIPYVRFAWIGMVQSDSFEVKPVAWAGHEEGYLALLRVTWDDSPHSQGPIGLAIKSKQPVVIDDVDDDHRVLPWRTEALTRGYASIISLPLIYGQEPLGTLNVYSGKKQAFGSEELGFLNQVAGDIAVGIRSFRLEQDLVQSVIKLQIMIIQTVETIGTIQEFRDPYTAGHQRGVTQLACALADELGLDTDRVEGLRVAGLLHDIGKIVVPTEILNKPGKLNEFEMNIIRSHPEAGYDILKRINFPWPVAQIVLQHHERINGAGYPKGLTGQDLLLEARILAVADVVEAMAAHRPYRPSLGLEKALDEIAKNSGILYDPVVAEACIKLFQEKGFTLSQSQQTL